MIRLELTQSEVRVGDRLKGQASWNSQGGKQPRKLIVELRWVLSASLLKRDELIDQAEELEIGSRSQVTVPFEFEIPMDVPLSYDGKLFRIQWEITARADLPFAVDETDTQTIKVLPARWTPDKLEEFRKHWDEYDGEEVDDDASEEAG